MIIIVYLLNNYHCTSHTHLTPIPNARVNLYLQINIYRYVCFYRSLRILYFVFCVLTAADLAY